MVDQAIKSKIALELYKALSNLGARSDLLSIVGSYGDTLPDEDVLRILARWNRNQEKAN